MWWLRSGVGTREVGVLLVGVLVLVSACSASVPSNIESSCAIFDHNRSWYRVAVKSYERWGIPVHVQLAIIHQESRFKARAKPPRKTLLWFIPGPRPSTAYGFTQAIDTTWEEYIRDTGNRGADRDDFADATDFIGWYGARSAKANGIAPGDAYSLYLAYHEGDDGYRRKTYLVKPWLLMVAHKVEDRSQRYRRQLQGCEDRFQPRWWTLWTF